MSNDFVITIARQYGSGGREIGKRIADKLGIPFYDKELIAIAAKKSGISEEIFEQADEKAANSLLYSLMLGSYNYGGHFTGPSSLPVNDKLFIIQSDIIKDAAKQGPCVIVGRCANYILRDTQNCFHVFVHADKVTRINRAVNEYGENEEKAASTLMKKDKTRAAYYNFYTNRQWGDLENYHLSLDSGLFGIENSVELICHAAEICSSSHSI